MSDVLALIPARKNSRGIPNKNFRELDGMSPVERATQAAKLVADAVVISSDSPLALAKWNSLVTRERLLVRPPELAQDDTPMIDVVKHVLEQIPGTPDQVILLLQPTQPLRQPKHLTQAIARLQDGDDWDSIVSVTPIPRTHAPDFVLMYGNSTLTLSPWTRTWAEQRRDDTHPTRRQDVPCPYVRDGTVYAFWRKTVEQYGDIYGDNVSALIIPTEETCPLDSPADWKEAERRLRERDEG